MVPGGAGVSTLINGFDDATNSIDLSTNTFNFYGTSYTGASQLFVSSNGLISLGSSLVNWTNLDLSSQFFTNQPLITPFWDDLQTNGGSGATDSTVLAKFDTDQLTIEWSNVPHVTDVGAATFQVILELNTGTTPGDITFNYVDVDFGSASFDDGASATVGLQNVVGSNLEDYNQLVNNGSGSASDLLEDGTAFTFAAANGAIEGTVLQEIEITGVESGDRLLVNALAGDDQIFLENSSVSNSKVGLNAILIGGPGNDIIHDGLGTDTLFGDRAYTRRDNDGIDLLYSDDSTGGDRLIGPSAADGFFSSLGFAASEDTRLFEETIIDNSDTSGDDFYRELLDYTGLDPDTDWTDGILTPSYESNYRAHITTNWTTPSDHVTRSVWTAKNTTAGWYQFLTTWKDGASRSNFAPYSIVDRVEAAVSGAGGTTTQFTTNLSSTEDDFYNGAVVIFASGTNSEKVRVVSDYNGTTKLLTIDTALATAPGDGDTFTVTAPVDTTTGSVSNAASTPTTTAFDTDLTAATDTYEGGVITFTSGTNAGESAFIVNHNSSNGRITLNNPLPSAPANTDAFTLTRIRIRLEVNQSIVPSGGLDTLGGVGWRPLIVKDSGGLFLAKTFPIRFGTANIELSNDTGNQHVIADAVRIQPVAEWFLDNSDTQVLSPFEYYEETGSGWLNDTSGGFGSSAREIKVEGVEETADWTLRNLVSGDYEVFVRWNETPTGGGEFRSPAVSYKIMDDTTQLGTTQNVDQTVSPQNSNNAVLDVAGNYWKSLGQYGIQSGTLNVEVSSTATLNAGGDTYVSVDAIRVVRRN